MVHYSLQIINFAFSAAKNLIACGIHKNYIKPDYSLYGHRDVKVTDCPGDHLYSKIQNWVNYDNTAFESVEDNCDGKPFSLH